MFSLPVHQITRVFGQIKLKQRRWIACCKANLQGACASGVLHSDLHNERVSRSDVARRHDDAIAVIRVASSDGAVGT